MQIELMTNEETSALRQIIEESENIVICTHTNPDGDAIGSSLGLAEYLRVLGKKTLVAVPNPFPDFLHWLPGSNEIKRYDMNKAEIEKAFKEAQLVFCLDFNDPMRIEGMAGCLTECTARKVLIDHHPNPTIDSVVKVSYPLMSSTCEIVFRVIWQLGGFSLMNKDMATCIYCGMMTDTGSFTFNSNSPEIFFIISQLLTLGIDKDEIYRKVYHNYSTSRVRLMGYVMSEKLKVYEDYHASYFVITRKEMLRFNFKKGDAEGLVNMPLQIKDLKLSISLREDKDKKNLVWVSLRSVGDFSCTEMANKYFNGGGHLNASGGKLFCSVEEAENIVKLAILDYQEQLRE